MNILSLNSLVCWQITLTLLHVSWIGLVIGLIAALANAVLRNSTAHRRYWLNFASLLLFAASLPITFAIVRGVTAEVPTALNVAETPVSEVANLTLPIVEEPVFSLPPTNAGDLLPHPPQSLSSDPEVPAAVSLPTVTQPPPSAWERVISIGHAAAPFVAVLYAFGVGLMFVKLAFGVRVSRKLRSAGQPVTDATILARLTEQAKKLSLRITPVVAYCEHTAVPIVVGLLRPMILIPAAMVNGLTIEQLESVLTHELAHLRRRDHLMIVVQRVLEAILFFHPVTWYLSHHLHDDRETSCDDLVLSIGGDRLQYAESLLRVAELRLAGQSHQKHIALAADGQRPSKLRLRIARLLGDTEGDSVRVSSVWLLTILAGTVIAGIWTLTATSQPVAAAIADEARIQTEESRKLIYQALASVRSIKTAHVKFRIARPGTKFRKTLDPKFVRQMIEDNDLVHNPDNLRRVLESFVSDASQIAEQPWGNVDLYREGKRVRTTTSSANHGPDEFVEDELLSLRWDAANWQMNITPIAKERYFQETLDQFLLPDDDLLNGSNGSISMFRYLERFRGEGSARTMSTDPQTGNVLDITIFDPADEVKTEYLRLGWKKYDDQIWFPTVVAELNYENGNLSRCQFIIIEQAVFNKPLPAGIFQLGAPAGSVIVEKRNDADWARKINRDVFDVTSVEQVQAALEPLSKELTHDEKNGVAEATRLYTLNEGMALKRIGPPFPLARKYVSRMLGDREAHRPRELSRLISWNGTKFESYHSFDGGTFSAGHVATLLTGGGSPELEGDKDLLELLLPGDFVFREGATKEDLLRDLQEIVSNEATTPVKIEFRNVERTVYRATGELKLNLPEGRSEVAINGGPHTGDFGESISGGNAISLLHSVAAYIKTRIINEVTAPDDRFEWSQRWYDLDSTKPENRFHLDAAVVLQQITEQTGIQFAEEKQVVPVLFIERANEKRPVADAPMHGVNDLKLPSIAEQINAIGKVVMEHLHRDEINYINDAQREELVSELKERLATRVSRPLPAKEFDKVVSAISHFFSDSYGEKFTRFSNPDEFMINFAVLDWRIWVGMDPVELTAEEFARRELQREWFRTYISSQHADDGNRRTYMSKAGNKVEMTPREYDLFMYEQLLSDPTYPFLFFPLSEDQFLKIKESLKLKPSTLWFSKKVYDEYENYHYGKATNRWRLPEENATGSLTDGLGYLVGVYDSSLRNQILVTIGQHSDLQEDVKLPSDTIRQREVKQVSGTPNQQSRDPRDLAWLIAQVERNERLYANIDLHARFQYEYFGGQGRDVSASTESDHWFIQQGQRCYGRNQLRVTRNDGQRAPSTEAMVFDGQRTFLADDGIVTDLGQGLAGNNLQLFPHTLLFRVTSHGVPLSVYLRGTEAIASHPLSRISGSDRKAETVYLGVEQINGLTCHHVAVRVDGGLPSHDFWLAEDRNFLVLQKTSHSARSGSDKPSAKAMVDSFVEIAPGIWMPSRGRIDAFNKDLIRKNGEQTGQWSEIFEVTAIDLNPKYSDEFFSTTILTAGVAADDAKGNNNRPWTAKVSGTCQDSDKQPITDAVVRQFNMDEVTRQGVLLKELRTDATGRFDFGAFLELDWLHRYAVTLSKPGYGSQYRSVRSRHNSPDYEGPITSTLAAADIHSGKVIDPDGKPIAGAKVRCVNCDLGVSSTVTDEDGRFLISDDQRPSPSSLSTRIFVQHSHWGSKTFQSKTFPQDETIQLVHPAIAEGKAVLRDGTPARNVPLYSRYVEEDSALGAQNATEIGLYTDDKGRFQFRFQGAGRISICSHPHDKNTELIATVLESFEVVPGETRTAPPILVTEGALIIGRVTSADAPPPFKALSDADLKNIYIESHPDSNADFSPFRRIAYLQNDGTFRMRVSLGKANIQFRASYPHPGDSPTRLIYSEWPQPATDRQLNLEEGQTYNFEFKAIRADVPDRRQEIHELPGAK